jgi:NADH-quinone oxidoreductase subunit E
MKIIIRETIRQFSKERSSLIPMLSKLQETEHYLSPQAITEVSLFLGVSENDVYSVASFYPRLKLARPVGHTIKVCQCTACYLMGGEGILDILMRELKINPGQNTFDFKFSLDLTCSPGCPDQAPIIVIDDKIHYKMTPLKIREILGEYK